MYMNDSRLSALNRQLRTLQGLILRDMITRFGRENIGFVWVIVEPMILCTGVLTLWTMMKPPMEHGIPVATLVLTGYMPLTLWRHLATAGNALLRRSMHVLYHASITGLDVFFSKAFMEILSTTAGAIVLFVALYFLDFVEIPLSYHLVMVGWLLMAWYSATTGLIIMALTEYTETVERFIQPFMYLSLPLSGAFFLLDWFPTNARDVIAWFPLPHAYELIRAGFFGDSITTHGSITYLLIWCISQTAVGLMMFTHVRKRVQFG